MNKYKGFTTFFALIVAMLPAVSFADSVYVINGLNEPAGSYTSTMPTGTSWGQTQGQSQTGVATYTIPGIDDQFNSNNTNGNVVTNNNSANNTNTNNTVSTATQENKITNPITDIFGIKIKSKAERDAEKAALDKQAAIDAENARVAYNNDGTFAYGYTNGNGAQYVNNARYVDARVGNGSNYTASAGTAFGGAFMPTTVGGWMLAILLSILLMGIIRAFMVKFNTKPQHAHAHAHAH